MLSPPPTTAFELCAHPEEGISLRCDAMNWLLGQGVSIRSFASPWAVRAAHVLFEPTGRYLPCRIGPFVYVLPCIASEGLIDLVAWQPMTGRVASRLGAAGLLGQRQAEQAASYITARPIRVWKSPIGWLRAGRSGVVIVDPPRAAHLLSGINLIPQDVEHGRVLAGTLRVPPPRILSAERIAA